MTSSYRFSGPFVVRLMGVALVAVGVLVLLLVALVALLSLPAGGHRHGRAGRRRGARGRPRWPAAGRSWCASTRRATGSGTCAGPASGEAEWKQVEDVAAATVAGERCVVLRLRDGRTTTVPVGVLAARTEDFVDDLRAHLDRGHGYRRVPPAR